MDNKVIVYTAITGSYDELRDPLFVNPGYDYVCFTDNDHLTSKVWHIEAFPAVFEEGALTIRSLKQLPHRFFGEYDYSIWIDGNTVIKRDLDPLLQGSLEANDIAFFRHPENRPSVTQEVEACIALRKESKQKLIFQRDLYYSLGFTDAEDAIPAGYVIFRRHNQPALILAMEEWWMHVLAYSKRDQVSFPFVAWKQNLQYTLMDHAVFLDHFVQSPHSQDERDRIISFISQGGLFQVDNRNGTMTITRHKSDQ